MYVPGYVLDYVCMYAVPVVAVFPFLSDLAPHSSEHLSALFCFVFFVSFLLFFFSFFFFFSLLFPFFSGLFCFALVRTRYASTSIALP